MWECIEDEQEDYREHDAISQSDLKKCMQNPLLYFKMRIQKSITQPPSSSAQKWGRMCESFLRDGSLGVSVIPDEVLSDTGRRVGKRWDRWKECTEDWEEAIKPDEETELLRAYSAVLDNIDDHDMARSIINGCDIKWSFRCRWESDAFPLQFKAELDIVDVERRFVCDVKTSRDIDPGSFRRDVLKYGYDIQAAHYLMGMTHAGHDVHDDWDYLWLTIRNKQPYDVAVYRATPDMVNHGAKRRSECIANYVRCLVSNSWHRDDHGRVVDIELPQYLKERDDVWQS